MNSKFRNTSDKSINHFASFVQAVERIFEFLSSDFGFSLISVERIPPECAVIYRNKVIEVAIAYEQGSSIYVSLAQLSTDTNEAIESERYDLSLLMEIRCPEIDHKQLYNNSITWSGEYIEEILQVYADFIKAHASDVLMGNFGVFPALKQRSSYYKRKVNKELFGSCSGETPRFHDRPTLMELFAAAKKEGRTEICIYQAYWDYEYSIKEIADYLGIGESVVKQTLENWDS